jgi:hypothetical protein
MILRRRRFGGKFDRAHEKSGIKILPLGKWLEELPFQTIAVRTPKNSPSDMTAT